jgi:RNA-binding motif X-linked protein 2
VYIGGLSYELSEGDIICVMSQWGEIEDINLIRDKETNKSMGFAFLKYENQKSTILAVDNFNGISVLGRILRCDHVEQYKLPKDIREREEEKLEENPFLDVIIGPGHAYQNKEMENDFSITKGEDLWSQERDSTYKG